MIQEIKNLKNKPINRLVVIFIFTLCLIIFALTVEFINNFFYFLRSYTHLPVSDILSDSIYLLVCILFFLTYSRLKKMEKGNFNGYMGEKRKELVKKFGFDTKNSAHCIRLLRMGIEFLVSGELNVFREDAPMLLDIKRGKWTLEEIKKEAERLFTLADEAYVRSTIPERPDRDGVEKIVKEIMMDYLTGDN